MKSFVLNNELKIYFRPGGSVIDYADGGEEYLLNIFRNLKEIKSYSPELLAYVKDWPSRYHLSLRRTNIIEAVSELLDKDSAALELGSGCGAITKWLGENFKSVDAVEGSQTRALVTRERTRDLSNVNVYCGNMLEISYPPDKYGLVTLIGVMEYVPKYSKSGVGREQACIDFLRNVKATLREDGILLLAIENKFGAKYFSGCTEDHTGKHFEGIIGYPNQTAITFSRQELKDILSAAGFENIQFYHLFPDYKLPETFLREDDETLSLNPYNWIKTPFEDYSGGKANIIPEPLFLKNLTHAGLLWDFSNSFLVLASKSAKTDLSTQWLIKKFSNSDIYNSVYHHTVTLLKDEKGDYLVKRNPIHEGKDSHATQLTTFKLTETDRFQKGDLLIFEAYKALVSESYIESIVDIMRKVHTALLAGYSRNRKDDEGYDLVDGNTVDYVLWNLIEADDESLNNIDRKWRFKEELPADYVLFRSLLGVFSYLGPFIKEKSFVQFTIQIISRIYPAYSEERLKMNLGLEVSFQGEVGSLKMINFFELQPNCNIFEDVQERNIAKQELAAKDRQLAEKDQRIEDLMNSMSWRVTAPLRKLYELLGRRPNN